MKVLLKLKDKGLYGIIHWITYHIANAINITAYNLYLKSPIDQKLLIFESEGDMSDNSYALFDYMRRNGLLKGYRIVWLISGNKDIYERRYDELTFYTKYPERIDIKRSKALATARYYIFDHSNVYDNLRKRNGFKNIYLTHGCTFKASTNADQYENNADEVYYTGKLYTHPMEKFCCCKKEVMFDVGYPRNDFLLDVVQDIQNDFLNKHSLNRFKKIALWMPTFRKSKNKYLSEEYFDNITGLPILESEKDLCEFNEILKSENIVCIFKIHHLQAELTAFNTFFSNLLIIKDEMLSEDGIQLYQMVRITDFLITDYSSIGNDYLLMDKPIIYTLDDYEQYRKSRGFSVEDPAKYFVGEHVIDKQQLFTAVIDAGNDIDRYKKERNELLPLAHTYQDGNASKRISERLGLIDRE